MSDGQGSLNYSLAFHWTRFLYLMQSRKTFNNKVFRKSKNAMKNLVIHVLLEFSIYRLRYMVNIYENNRKIFHWNNDIIIFIKLILIISHVRRIWLAINRLYFNLSLFNNDYIFLKKKCSHIIIHTDYDYKFHFNIIIIIFFYFLSPIIQKY